MGRARQARVLVAPDADCEGIRSMAAQAEKSLVITKYSLVIADLFVSEDHLVAEEHRAGAKTPKLLTIDEIIAATGLSQRSAYSVMKSLVETGWFGVAWQELDPYDFSAKSPTRGYFLLDEHRDEFARRINSYKADQLAVQEMRKRANEFPGLHAEGEESCAHSQPGSSWSKQMRMTPARARIMRLFLINPTARISLTDIANSVGRCTPSVHVSMNELESKGWFTSRYEPGPGGRGNPTRRMFALTPSGEKAAREIVAAYWPRTGPAPQEAHRAHGVHSCSPAQSNLDSRPSVAEERRPTNLHGPRRKTRRPQPFRGMALVMHAGGTPINLESTWTTLTMSTSGLVTHADLADLVATHGEEVEFPRGDVIFTQRTWEDRFYLIRSGKVKIGLEMPDGRESLLAIYGPSDVFGEVSMFDPGPPASFAIAVTEVQAVSIHRAALHKRISARPELADYMLRSLARRVRQTHSNLADLVFTDVPGRVARALLQFAAQFGHEEGRALRLTHDLTQKELAQYVGATREAVNRALSRFAQRGWLRVEGTSALILAPDQLLRRVLVSNPHFCPKNLCRVPPPMTL